MVLADNIYTDIEKKKQFRKKLDLITKGKHSVPFFVVTLPVFTYGILEIYEYNELLQNFYRKLDREIVVVGVSNSRDGARQLVADILEDHIDREGVFVWP